MGFGVTSKLPYRTLKARLQSQKDTGPMLHLLIRSKKLPLPTGEAHSQGSEEGWVSELVDKAVHA